ncbi:hypothetical protein ACFYSC_34755 [Streptosporangium sp. NPDC004379]|uniref:hypothetical protein n=1 Tax=Streptosporangium sp. NPDC004379 TaxID=3366189 RepID=UPI0036970B90
MTGVAEGVMWLAGRPRPFPASITPVCGYGAVGFIEYPGVACLLTGGGSFGVIGSPAQAGMAVYPGRAVTTGTAVIGGRPGAWRPPSVACPEVTVPIPVAVPVASASTVCCVTVATAPC